MVHRVIGRCGGRRFRTLTVFQRCSIGRFDRLEQAVSDPNSLSSLQIQSQPGYSEQIIRSRHEVGPSLRSLHTPVTGSAHAGDGFHPSKYFFHPLADSLAGLIAAALCRAGIQTSHLQIVFARHVRRDSPLPTSADKLLLMIGLVSSQRGDPGFMQATMLIDLGQRHGRFILGDGIMNGDGGAQSMAVFHEHVCSKRKLAGLTVGLSIQDRFRVGRALVRVVAALFSMKVNRRIARVIVLGRGYLVLILSVFAHKTLQAGPRLDEGAVGREMLVTRPAFLTRKVVNLNKEELGDISGEDPLIIVGENRRIETSLIEFPIEKPKPQKIIGQLLAEKPFTAHRIEGHEDAALEQLFGWNRRTSFVRIELVKQGRKLGQDLVYPLFDAAQGMVGRHPLVEVDRGQELRLSFGFSAHADPIDANSTLFKKIPGFSAAC